MQAIIMAGGKGTRLRSITNDEIPKPMVPILGKPILQWQIETLKREGISNIVLVIGHLGNRIQEYFQDGSQFGVTISYFEEKEPLGTAGALAFLSPQLCENDFFLIFGDVIFDIDLQRMMDYHNQKNAIATLFVHPNTHPYDSDLVVCDSDNKIVKFDHKNDSRKYWHHNCVNAGFYLMNREICTQLSKNQKTDLEKELLAGLIKNQYPVYAYSSTEYIKDVGTVERLKKSEDDLQNGIVSQRNLKQKQKAIFLDRDGTINRKNGLIFQENQLELEDEAADAIHKINDSGYLAIVVTNQPVVARGMCTIEQLEKIHMKMETLLGNQGAYLDEICYCPHHPDKGYPEENPIYKIPCCCRKPNTGMIEKCVEKYNIDLNQSWMIGDTTVDIQTGKNANMHTALVLTGDAGKDHKYSVTADLVCKNLLEAVEKIIK